MGNIFQKLRIVLEDRMILAVLFFTHVFFVGKTIGLLNSKETISFLYILNLTIIIYSIKRLINQVQQPRQASLKNHSVLRPVKEYHDFMESSSNLYIDHWKNLNIYRSPEFPLERLAFLNATIYDHCHRKHNYNLRNSQVKQLSVRKVSSKHCDEECHPKKLVTDLFASYVHRRSLFYNKRNVCAASKRQLTTYYYNYAKSGSFDPLPYSLLFGLEVKKQLEDNLELEGPSSDGSAGGKCPRRYFISVKKAMSSAVGGLISEGTQKWTTSRKKTM